jgi:hypothetical protein
MLSREELLEQAQRNVDAARRRVEQRRRLIAELESDGHDTEIAQHLLLAFEQSQALFERELKTVLNEETEPTQIGANDAVPRQVR